MNLYHKPTDSQRCLPFTSSKSNLCKRNIPFGLAQRICAIAENNAEEFGKLKIKFIKIQFPGFADKTRISESSLDTTKRLTKT